MQIFPQLGSNKNVITLNKKLFSNVSTLTAVSGAIKIKDKVKNKNKVFSHFANVKLLQVK